MKTVQVMGPGCPKCKQLEQLAREAVAESGADAEVVKITDFQEMASMGVFSTPALAIDGQVMAVGRVANKKEIMGWLG